MKQNSKDKHILSISSNQNNDCILCTTLDGFIVYHINPFQTVITRFIEGGIRLGAMYNRSNIFVLCGTGISKQFPINRAILWNDEKQAKHAEISVSAKIERLSITKDELLLLFTNTTVYIYNLTNLTELSKIDIFSTNIDYIINKDNAYISYSKTGLNSHGMIYIHSDSFTNTRNSKCFKAHDNEIANLTLSKSSQSSNYIATCSIKSTTIKIFDSETFSHYFTFHRGIFKNPIVCLSFSSHNRWLFCSTESGTLHIFSLGKDGTIFSNQWIPQYKRHSSKYDISEPLEYIYCDDQTYIWHGYSKSTLYIGKIVNDREIILEKQFLLAIKKDPFSSPKTHKKISSHI